MRGINILLALLLGASIGAAAQWRVDARRASASHGDSVCLALVKAGVVVSCTYEGEE